MKDTYNKVNNVIKELDKSGLYKIIKMIDKVIDIDISEYNGSLDGIRRYYIRKQILANLSLNQFYIGKYIYRASDQISNYVVIFKIERRKTKSHK